MNGHPDNVSHHIQKCSTLLVFSCKQGCKIMKMEIQRVKKKHTLHFAFTNVKAVVIVALQCPDFLSIRFI